VKDPPFSFQGLFVFTPIHMKNDSFVNSKMKLLKLPFEDYLFKSSTRARTSNLTTSGRRTKPLRGRNKGRCEDLFLIDTRSIWC